MPTKPAVPRTPSRPAAAGAAQKKPGPGPARPPSAAPTTPAAVKKPSTGAGASGPQTLVVSSKAQKEDVGLETLVGEYVETGKNHGRSFFKRKPGEKEAEDRTAVFLYYWDMRDGADFSGWWFGDQVGGAQVWSRCEKSDQKPPQSGWRVPWDGKVNPDLVVEPKKADAPAMTKVEIQEAKEELADTSVDVHAEMDERVQRATDRVVIAEIEATQCLESVHAMMEGDVSEDSLKVVEELLQAQQTSMMDAHKVLAADIMDARKSAPKTVQALSNLTPRVRTVQASLAQEMKQAKQLFAKKKQEAQDLKEREKAEEAQMKAEQRDAKALEEALPEAMEIVTSAEDMLESVVTAASPLAIEFAEQMSEPVLLAIKDTEAAVAKAMEAIKEARSKINQKVMAAKQFAPEARKVALTEYSALQDKLNEAQKKLTPYARVRKDYEQKLEAKKVMTEVASKLGAVEVDVEKATSLLTGTLPSEEEIKSAESMLPPVATSLLNVMKLVKQRLQGAQGALKEDLGQMQERGVAMKKKLDAFRAHLRSLLEQLQVQIMLRQGLEKTHAAEEALAQTTVAEAPFLKGIELLPGKDAEDAVSASKEAAKVAEAKIYAAQSFLKAKLADDGHFPAESRESTVDELTQLQARVEVVAQKLAAFKRETATRETSMLLQEVMVKVIDAEAKVKKTAELSTLLSVDKLEDLGVGKLKEATEQTLDAEKAAALACADARKVLMAKQKDGQVKESPGYAAELSQLQDRLSSAQQELSKQRKVAVQGEKLWKSKLIVQEKEEQMKQLEAEIEKAELLTTPLGDETPSNNNILEMDASVNIVQKALDDVVESLKVAQQSAQGSLKAQLVKLLARTKKSQESINEMKATTREQRERVQCESVLSEARAKLEKVSATFQLVAEAEVPYLKGVETLPVDEAAKAVAQSEAASAAVQQAISDARTFIASKSLEVKGLIEVVATAGMQELEALAKKNEEAKEKLAQFNKETEGRKRIALQQEALAKVAEAEDAVQRTILAAAPLAAEDETSQDAAQEIVEKLGESEKEAQDKLSAARKFLLERQRDRKAKIDPAELSQLVSRLNSVQVDLAKAKAAASEVEQRFVAKVLLQEAAEIVQGLESELEKATEAAAPLTVEGGKSFVVASMTKMILEALNEHSTKQGLSKDHMFLQISPGAAEGKVTEPEFLTYLEKVPELCSRPDLAFSSEQRAAIFEQLDGDKDGMISKSDFTDVFRDRYICVEEVDITNDFDTANSQNVDKLLVDDVVEALGEQKSLDVLGLIRVEVRVLKDGTTGWVTMQDNQGATYLSPFTAYTAFVRNLDRTISATQSSASKVSSFIASKSAELREVQEGPLSNAKAELAKLRPKVNLMRQKLEQLHKKVEDGKREHSKREEFERKKQEEKKDRKAASLILKAMSEKVDKAQVALQQLEEAAFPFTSTGESDLGSIATPMTVRNSVTALGAAVSTVVGEAKESLTANEGRVVKASKGPWYEAKQDMMKLQQQTEAIEKKANDIIESVQRAYDTLAEAKIGQVSTAIRSSIQARGISIVALYSELAGENGEQISEATFSKHLDSLGDVRLTPEHKQMLFQKSGAGGISRRSFLAMLERYFKCVKEIAITSDFEIKVSTTLRKLEIGEFVEVLEGPQSDDSLGVMRIRARALSDGKTGWVTAKGNQGTPFLQECMKPCYFACQAVPMQNGFPTEGCNDVRTLKLGEVIEVLEGPRKEVVGNAIRARGKATSDGATGWFTVKNKQGEPCVQQGKSTYTCVSGIALTNDMNIKDCKVLRKLDKGEVLMVLDGPIDDESAGVTRIKARAPKDDLEGWVTTKGNAGSVYAEESGRTYVVSTSMPLQTSFQSDSASDVRMLIEGESIEVLEGPKEEKSNAAVRVHGRAVTDGKTGWVTIKKEAMKLWSPTYKCVAATTIGTDLKESKAEAIRNLEPREVVELLEGPKEDADSGVLRLKGRAEADGVVGWVTISREGKPIMVSLPPP